MALVYLILTLLCLVCYFTRRYTAFLVCYFALLSHLLMLDVSESGIKGEDFCIMINLVICAFLIFRKRFLISGTFGKYLLVFMGFYVVEYILTVLSGNETAVYGLKVIRISWTVLFYFICRTLPVSSLMNFLRIAFWITLAQGILFILQFAGIHLIYGYNPDNKEDLGYLLNMPPLTIPYVFICLRWKYVAKIRPVVILYLLSLIFLTGSRAAILSVLIGTALYLWLTREEISRKQMLRIISCAIVILPVSVFIMSNKSSKSDASTKSDLTGIMDPSNLVDFQSGSGTLTFRLAMLVERWMYLADNPQYLLTGVGTIHEDSPSSHRKFDFYIGTINEEREMGYCQIESGDITWVPVSLRYGILGVLIHLAFFYFPVAISRKRKDFLLTLTPLCLCMFILSFSGPFFEDGTKLVSICYLCGLAVIKVDNKTEIGKTVLLRQHQ